VPQKPDGNRPSDRITFTRGAAERIAEVVRTVELGDRDQQPLRYEKVPCGSANGGKIFRICTFTGAWATGDTKTVTFKFQPSTPNTVVATNLFFPFPEPANATDCSIARDGTAWFLVDVPFETATAVFVGATASQTIVSDVEISAVLNTSDCAITVSRTQTTASVAVVSSTFTSMFLTFKVT
jgi:hypothetical protein